MARKESAPESLQNWWEGVVSALVAGACLERAGQSSCVLRLGKYDAALADVDTLLPLLATDSADSESHHCDSPQDEDQSNSKDAQSLREELLRLKPAPAPVQEVRQASETPPGFKRMQIVEDVVLQASDDEDEEEPPKAPASPAKPTEAKAPAAAKPAEASKAPAEPYADIKLEYSVDGAEKGKQEANRLFTEGKLEESARWFSKAIWLVEESGKVTGVTAALRGILRSNRAFARIKLRQWAEAESDCSEALSLNASNAKALYRRAMARKELGKYDAALADVDTLLPLLDQSNSKDAQSLREELLRLKPAPAPVQEVRQASETPLGFKRMQIVEASDDEDEEEPPKAPASPAKPTEAKAPAAAKPAEASKAPAEPYADIKLEYSVDGAEKGKQEANRLFTEGKVEESARWFSKAIWLVEESGKVTGVTAALRGILRSNRVAGLQLGEGSKGSMGNGAHAAATFKLCLVSLHGFDAMILSTAWLLPAAFLSTWAYASAEENLTGNSSGWLHLCREVAALRSQLPPFIAKMGRLYEARQVVSIWAILEQGLDALDRSAASQATFHTNGGNCKKRRLRLRKDVNATSPLWNGEVHASCDTAVGSGPWRLKLDMTAPPNASAAYQRPQRLLLVFTTAWPQVLPQVRFVSKLQSIYAKEVGEEKMDFHVREPTGKLLARIHENFGEGISCMWRQTSACKATGAREPDRDRLCSEKLPAGVSGFCDCDGDDLQGQGEPGYDCQEAPGSCESVCPNVRSQSAPSVFELKRLLTVLHRSLGGPLHASDERAWQKGASTFTKSASTVVRYKSFGRKHPFLFESAGLRMEDAIDPSMLKLIASLDGSSRDAARKLGLNPNVFRLSGRSACRKQLRVSFSILAWCPKSFPVSPLALSGTSYREAEVFSFPIFKTEFCELLMEEIRHFYGSKLPAKRPNSMNNYGIILNDIGLEPLIFDLQDAVIQPLASVLLPVEGAAGGNQRPLKGPTSGMRTLEGLFVSWFPVALVLLADLKPRTLQEHVGSEAGEAGTQVDLGDAKRVLELMRSCQGLFGVQSEGLGRYGRRFNVNIFGNYTGAPLVFCGINGEPDHRHFRTAYQHRLLGLQAARALS
ncbi:OGFOD2 [Symbiodinium natans]|uniref:OGFOD2 protein n=1 Tax=Symbiodinium natans TaxID=878477 RepID=A0A812KLR1_9DINO|nr:OGFOD2 [Symbiodinium natans]